MDSEQFLFELFNMSGKTAVIIGGTGVLCGAMAKGLWRSGAAVILIGRNGDKARSHFEEWGADESRARFFRADATQQSDVRTVIPAAEEWFGSVDVWINGAGVNSATPYLDIEEEEVNRLVDANLKSVHLGCQTIGEYWIARKQSGSIINLSSMAAIRPLSRVFIYSAAKAAVWNLTQNLAREWAPYSIRVNALCPGFFPSEQNRKILDQSRVNDILSHTPMARFGEAEELIAATLLLASEKAGGFITGTNLVVDGGFSAASI